MYKRQDEDYILYTASSTNGVKWSIESIAPAEVVEGTVDAYSVENYVTIDGTKLEYAAKIEMCIRDRGRPAASISMANTLAPEALASSSLAKMVSRSQGLTVGIPFPPFCPMALAAPAKTSGSAPSPVKAAIPALSLIHICATRGI